jgi:cell division protein FtsQ
MTLRVRVIAAVAISFLALTYLFAWSPLLTVKTISTSGFPEGVSAESIVAKSGITIGEKMARIEPRSVEKLLGEISWVKTISVSRNWMKGDVAIELAERVPVGLYKGRAIDASGTLFELPGSTPANLPTVSAATPELGLSAITLFTELPNDLKESLLSLSASNSSSINSWHREPGRNVKITWGSVKELELKVSVYRALLTLPENKSIRRVDLSAPHAPIVK